MTLLAAYNFDEASGTVIDVTGNGHDITLAGTSTRDPSGHTSKGLKQTTSETSTTLAPFGQTANRTIMAWIKSAASVSDGRFFEFVDPEPQSTWEFLFRDTAWHLQAWHATNFARATTTRPTDGLWHHFAGTYDGTNLRMYKDGVLAATTACAALRTTATVINIMNATGTNMVFDDVRLYDTALDVTTINTLMGTPVTSGSAFSGNVALSGAGALTNAGAPGHTGPVTLAGSGSLAEAGTPAVAGALALTGAGQVAGAGSPTVAGALGLSGAGTASDAGSPAVSGTTALAGTGALTENGTPGFVGPVALSGTGTIASAGQPMLPGNLSLTGGGTLTGAAGNDFSGTAGLSGSGLLAAIGAPAHTGAVHFTGSGQLVRVSSDPVTQPVLTAGHSLSSGLTAAHPQPDLTPSNAPSSQLEVSHVV